MRELIETIRLTERVSEAIHGLLDEGQIYKGVREEFEKAEKYDQGIFLLTEDGTRLRIGEFKIAAPQKIRRLEKLVGISLEGLTLDAYRSDIFRQVLREGKTLHYQFKDLIESMFPSPIGQLIAKTLGLEKVTGVMTPLKRRGKIIGAFSMSAPDLAEYFAPSVRSLATHISTALDMADEHAARIQMEEALKESEEKYRAIVENSPNFVAILQDGVYKYVNRAMCEKLGWTFEEMTDPSFDPLEKVTPERFRASTRENIEERLRGKPIIPHETVVKRRDGFEVPVTVRAQNIIYQGKPAIEYILFDITERKQAEAERLALISQMAKSIGHDLRSPLTSMKAATYILKNENLSEKGREMLDRINLNIEAADRIVKELHEFTVEAKLYLRRADINTLLQEILARTVTPGNVKVVTGYGDIPKAKVDAELLKRALDNLIRNAVQAMPQGGELTVSTKAAEDVISIDISDTGVGIPKENRKNLFTPFFTTKPEGMGLGLAGAKRIVEVLGGTIHVESEEGRGTNITVKIPAGTPLASS